jgi:hypothetical protein
VALDVMSFCNVGAPLTRKLLFLYPGRRDSSGHGPSE